MVMPGMSWLSAALVWCSDPVDGSEDTGDNDDADDDGGGGDGEVMMMALDSYSSVFAVDSDSVKVVRNKDDENKNNGDNIDNNKNVIMLKRHQHDGNEQMWDDIVND